MEVYLGTVLVRALHVLFGILWIGLLYYFNFVQTEYFKDADADAKSDVVQKLVPNALWYFRWAAAFTFLTGLYNESIAISPNGGSSGLFSSAGTYPFPVLTFISI